MAALSESRLDLVQEAVRKAEERRFLEEYMAPLMVLRTQLLEANIEVERFRVILPHGALPHVSVLFGMPVNRAFVRKPMLAVTPEGGRNA